MKYGARTRFAYRNAERPGPGCTASHYNSSQPAQLNAHAYAQGSEIHLAPGQEMHLPHEAWHVVQQAQGRVKPTAQMKGGVPVNDETGLEQEADAMGEKALQKISNGQQTPTEKTAPVHFSSAVRGDWDRMVAAITDLINDVGTEDDQLNRSVGVNDSALDVHAEMRRFRRIALHHKGHRRKRGLSKKPACGLFCQDYTACFYRFILLSSTRLLYPACG